MHPIPVRTMKFDVPASNEFHPLYIAGNAQLSYEHSAFGLYVSHLEPFFVKSLRQVTDRIRDEKLREEVDRFSRQEAQHYQRHSDFNKVVLAHGYPGLQERVDQLKRDFDGYLSNGSDQFRIGYIEGFESYTTQLALNLLGSGLYDHKRTNPAFGTLFRWHMLEEIDISTADGLFEPFQRFHSAAEFAGSGVGLATCKRIVRRHGGSIWVRSALGEGTTVFFSVGPSSVDALPLAIPRDSLFGALDGPAAADADPC